MRVVQSGVMGVEVRMTVDRRFVGEDAEEAVLERFGANLRQVCGKKVNKTIGELMLSVGSL